jgi:anaerobic selenocysteine-containing dehydrogenase
MCGIEVEIEQGRATQVRGDRSNPVSEGFTCIKGRNLPDQHAHPDRLLQSLRRDEHGALVPVGAETAMDEIAGTLRGLIDEHGPRSVALYAGTAMYQNSIGLPFARGFMAGLGSPSFYTSLSIDQPNKIIAPQLHGSFMGGTHSFASSDTWMIFGCNPLISLYGGSTGFPSFNPTKRIREALARGLDLIVVDPRRTELARMASLHLPVRPGEDAALLGGLLRVVVEEKLYDSDFCERFAEGLDELRVALSGFGRAFVERRTGLEWSLVEEAARRFARGPRGLASSGTGPSMAPHPNLTEHMIMSLNTLCGRYNRAGERIDNPGCLRPIAPFKEEAMTPMPGFRMGAQSRIRGLGQVAGELPTAALADEILTPGDGQVRALIVMGGNPILSFPDQLKAERALRSLDLLVVADPQLSATAELADYVIAPTLCLERPDVTGLMDSWFPVPFSMHAPAIAEPPGETLPEWALLWGLARRLDVKVLLPGGPVDLETKPTSEELVENITHHARVPLAEIKRHEGGAVFEDDSIRVAPGNPESPGRLQLYPELIAEEMAALCAEPAVEGAGYRPGAHFTHRLISRRLREVFNSCGQELPAVRAKRRHNPAFMSPEDLDKLGVASGDLIQIDSGHAAILGVVEAADDVPSGVISMSHSWGGLPARDHEVREIGSSTNRLIDNASDYDPISGMARQSAIPVNVRPASENAGASHE